jgi:transcriptional regulator with XRE-family HTH domain
MSKIFDYLPENHHLQQRNNSFKTKNEVPLYLIICTYLHDDRYFISQDWAGETNKEILLFLKSKFTPVEVEKLVDNHLVISQDKRRQYKLSRELSKDALGNKESPPLIFDLQLFPKSQPIESPTIKSQPLLKEPSMSSVQSQPTKAIFPVKDQPNIRASKAHTETGKELVKLRNLLGMTQLALSNAISASPSAVSSIEINRRKFLKTEVEALYKLCKEKNIPITYEFPFVEFWTNGRSPKQVILFKPKSKKVISKEISKETKPSEIASKSILPKHLWILQRKKDLALAIFESVNNNQNSLEWVQELIELEKVRNEMEKI